MTKVHRWQAAAMLPRGRRHVRFGARDELRSTRSARSTLGGPFAGLWPQKNYSQYSDSMPGLAAQPGERTGQHHGLRHVRRKRYHRWTSPAILASITVVRRDERSDESQPVRSFSGRKQGLTVPVRYALDAAQRCWCRRGYRFRFALRRPGSIRS